MVCLDRDRGAICCCSGGARLPRGLAAGAGTGGIGGEDGGAVGGAPRSTPRRTVVFGMPPAPDPDAEAGESCGRSYPPTPILKPEPGAGVRRQPVRGRGP